MFKAGLGDLDVQTELDISKGDRPAHAGRPSITPSASLRREQNESAAVLGFRRACASVPSLSLH